MYNPLASPICFRMPERMTEVSAWLPHTPFAMALVAALRPRLFVELGTQKGDSYCAFCQAVRDLGLETRTFAVDTWQGDAHAGLYGAEVLSELRAHHDPRYGAFSTLLQMTFDEALSRFEDGSIDLLHIDGCHRYDAVRHDFERWLPKLSRRAVVLFHDVRVKEGDFGVYRFWEEIRQQYEHFELAHAFGLGVLLVGRDVPGSVRGLALSAREEAGFDLFFETLGSRVTRQEHIDRLNEYIERQHATYHAQQAQIVGQREQLDHQARQLHEQAQHLGHLAAKAQQQEAQIAAAQEQIHEQARLLHQQLQHLGHLAAERERLRTYIEQLESLAREQAAELDRREQKIGAQMEDMIELSAVLDAQQGHIEQQAGQLAAARAENGLLREELHGVKQRLFFVQLHYTQYRYRLVDRVDRLLRRSPRLHAAIKHAARLSKNPATIV
jgi:hypothetical protein